MDNDLVQLHRDKDLGWTLLVRSVVLGSILVGIQWLDIFPEWMVQLVAVLGVYIIIQIEIEKLHRHLATIRRELKEEGDPS